MANEKKKKTYHIRTLCYYPCDIFIPADNKQEAIALINDKDKWHMVEQDHHIEDHQFDTFYVEDLKEFQGKRDIKRKTSYNQSEITNVYSDNNEGLSDRMPSEQSEED
tara:strand:- start:588 stop:911 length:324 start_codon:yes stop_codon:yes gene_type:complete